MNLKFHQPDYTAYKLSNLIYTVHRTTRKGISVSAPSLTCKPHTLGVTTYQSDDIRVISNFVQRQGNAFE